MEAHMQWENLTSPDFEQAVRETGVCILAMGVLERHSDHLPLGTDFLNGHRLACRAAENEPAVVFPPFYFGQIYEARCFPGALTVKPTLLIELLQAVFDEIGRNGFRKIIIVNAHGGNAHLIPFLAQSTLWEQKPYSLYWWTGKLGPDREQIWKAALETKRHGHACECETSITLANFPHLVKMDAVPAEPAEPLGRIRAVPGGYAGIWWYSDYPNHYAGDARSASVEKGRVLSLLEVDALAEFIAAVKQDKSVPALEEEFFSKTDHMA
jgi:creatinine amidohydrolase